MKRINIYIADPQYAQFQRLAREHGRPYSELIREALDQYLTRHVWMAREAPSQPYGTGHKGPSRRKART